MVLGQVIKLVQRCLDVGRPPLKQLNECCYFSFMYAWTRLFISIYTSCLTRPYFIYIFLPFLLEFHQV